MFLGQSVTGEKITMDVSSGSKCHSGRTWVDVMSSILEYAAPANGAEMGLAWLASRADKYLRCSIHVISMQEFSSEERNSVFSKCTWPPDI
jgi:hypothetical protein